MDYYLSLDMDGVLPNFNKGVGDILGIVMQGHDNPINWVELEANHPNLFYNLKPMEDMHLLLFFLEAYIERGIVDILTALPRKVPFKMAKGDKVSWIRRYVSQTIPVKFGPYAEDKHKHCRGPKHILIDDSPLNISDWNKAGGIGILHQDAASTILRLQQIGL